MEIIYSIYKNNPELLESFLYIDVENYLELMPNDIVKEYQAMKERRKSSMGSNMTFNITGGQINIAKDNGNVNAIQNNGIGNKVFISYSWVPESNWNKLLLSHITIHL